MNGGADEDPGAIGEGRVDRSIRNRRTLAAERRRRAAQAGEHAAAAHLESHGYALLARNLRVGRHEIDILAVDPRSREVVVVEVKCRTGSDRRPEDRVDHGKRRGLALAAELLGMRSDLRGARFRFDVIAVDRVADGTAVTHWQAAFDQGM